MHDTRLHTEPDEFVFVRRSRPLTEFDFMAWARDDDPNMRFRFFDPSIENARSPRMAEILKEYEQKGRIFVKSSIDNVIDSTRQHAYHYDEYGQMSEPKVNLFNPEIGLRVLQRLYDGPKAKNNFDDEPSKSTEQ